jgi:hypothetical protein
MSKMRTVGDGITQLKDLLASHGDQAAQVEEVSSFEHKRGVGRRLSPSQHRDVMHAAFGADHEAGVAPHSRKRMHDRHIHDMPDWHVKYNGWIAGAVDWRRLHRKILRLQQLERRRMEWWAAEAASHKHGAKLPEHLQSGYSWHDGTIAPTVIGRAFRMLGEKLSNDMRESVDEGINRTNIDIAVERVLTHNRDTHSHSSKQNGLLKQTVDVFTSVFDGRGRNSRPRRILESISSAAVNAPYKLGYVFLPDTLTTMMPYSYIPGWVQQSYLATQRSLFGHKLIFGASENEVSILDALYRFFVYNVLLCYLYAPPSEPSTALGTQEHKEPGEDTTTPDGQPVRTHHTSKMCFPAIPFSPIYMPTFREATNTSTVDYSNLTYAGVSFGCRHQLARPPLPHLYAPFVCAGV